jgi:hypothetical protein
MANADDLFILRAEEKEKWEDGKQGEWQMRMICSS